MYPALLSAPRTTQFFVRDDNDTFEIDLDRINSSNYSPLKLHRISFFLDVGHQSGSPMGFGFDGTMLVSVSPEIKTADQAADFFNKVKAALALGGLPLDATTETMIGFGELKTSGYFRYHSGLGAEAEIARALQEGGAGSLLNIRLLQPPRITQEQVFLAYQAGAEIIQKIDRLDAEYLTQAVTCLPKAEARNSLIFGWVACEQVVEQIWQDIFLSDEKFYIKDYRRKNLKGVNNVAQKLDTLFQAGIIDEHIYENAFFARKARNDFAHRGGSVSLKNGTRCVSALIGLIGVVAKHNDVPFVSATTILSFASPENRIVRPTVTTASKLEVSAPEPAAWRALYQIPGDENWKPGDEKVDGHQIGPVEHLNEN